jgi:hypothetical protein
VEGVGRSFTDEDDVGRRRNCRVGPHKLGLSQVLCLIGMLDFQNCTWDARTSHYRHRNRCSDIEVTSRGATDSVAWPAPKNKV